MPKPVTPENPANTSSCLDEYDPAALSVASARNKILEAVAPVSGTEQLALRQTLNRILAHDVYSPLDVPPATNSAMDGYAFAGSDLELAQSSGLHVAGTAYAGRPFQGKLTTGECVRIFTGAILPPGTDTVAAQERVTRPSDAQPDVILLDSTIRSGDNVRQAGEDISAGDCVLKAGTRLQAAELGLLASLGIGEIHIRRRVRVAFFSTGDELRSIGEPLEPGMLYDSNRYSLYGLLSSAGCELLDMGVVRDTPEATEKAFALAAENADVLITSGGVSVGDADYVKTTLDAFGQVNFWKVAMKPGRPLAFGKINNTVFFGLPGNPVSVMVTFYQFVQQALRKMMGETFTQPLIVRAVCQSKLRKRAGRFEFQRGILTRDDEGQLIVSKTGQQGSGILSSMTRANCFIMLPETTTDVEAGTEVEVQPFGQLF